MFCLFSGLQSCWDAAGMHLQLTTAALHILTALFNMWSRGEKLNEAKASCCCYNVCEVIIHELKSNRCRVNKDVYLLHGFVMSHCITASVDTRNYDMDVEGCFAPTRNCMIRKMHRCKGINNKDFCFRIPQYSWRQTAELIACQLHLCSCFIVFLTSFQQWLL